MKKVISILSAIVLVGCIAVLFYGCGAEDEEIITTDNITTTAPIESTMENEGIVTDESEPGDNGVIGDIVTDVSEGLSDIVTDVSEDMQDARNMQR